MFAMAMMVQNANVHLNLLPNGSSNDFEFLSSVYTLHMYLMMLVVFAVEDDAVAVSELVALVVELRMVY